jgi:hypothetical protein
VTIGTEAKVSTTEVIVSIVAEGGSIALIGNKGPNLDWQFARGVQDQTLSFPSKVDGGAAAIRHTSDWVNTWPEAMALLDRYPWAMLNGRQVHPEFRARVWTEVKRRLDRESPDYADSRRRRWAGICGVTQL